jgi:hypothetical protein
MNTKAIESCETEQERQQAVQELVAEQGPNWLEAFKPGSFGCHELLDRTSLAADIIERFVLSHPACAQNPSWYALAEQATACLRELYQRIGAEHAGEDSNTGGDR